MIEPVDHDGRYWSIAGRECAITIERRPVYCDRGRFIAKVFPAGRLVLEFDGSDGWPRYYFDWDRMLAEIEAWMLCRGQLDVEVYVDGKHVGRATPGADIG